MDLIGILGVVATTLFVILFVVFGSGIIDRRFRGNSLARYDGEITGNE